MKHLGKKVAAVSIGVVGLLGSLGVSPAGATSNAKHRDTGVTPYGQITVGLSNCNGGGISLTSGWRNKLDQTYSPSCWAHAYNTSNYGTWGGGAQGSYWRWHGGNWVESYKYTNSSSKP